MTKSYQPSSQRIALCLKACEGYSDEELAVMNFNNNSEFIGALIRGGGELVGKNEELTKLVEDFCYVLAKQSESSGISDAMLEVYMNAVKLLYPTKADKS